MFCTKCGKQLEEGTAFCPNCGTAQNSAEIPAPDIACQQPESTAVSKKGKKKGNKNVYKSRLKKEGS